MKNGTVEMFLRSRGASGGSAGRVQQAGTGLGTGLIPPPLQMMMEIAVGMAYLHRKGVLHGDLKVSVQIPFPLSVLGLR